jgi:hypothetical protein
VEEPRLTGAEIVAAIAVTVAIVQGTRKLIEEIRALIPQVKGLIHDVKGLQTVKVEVGSLTIPIDQVTDDQLQQLAREQGDND